MSRKIICNYMSSVIFVASRYNYSVDYWSLGLVSHEVITGVRPFLPNMAPVSWSVQKKKLYLCFNDFFIIFHYKLGH
jgi:serine/threonine protein kinase